MKQHDRQTARWTSILLVIAALLLFAAFYPLESGVTAPKAYAQYLNAARAGKNALALLTISNNPFTGESLTPDEVRTTFTQMMEIALEIA